MSLPEPPPREDLDEVLHKIYGDASLSEAARNLASFTFAPFTTPKLQDSDEAELTEGLRACHLSLLQLAQAASTYWTRLETAKRREILEVLQAYNASLEAAPDTLGYPVLQNQGQV